MSFDRAKLFSSNATTEREITACGETFTVHVRRLPAIDLRKYYAEVMSPEIDVRAAAGFDALSKAIRSADGKPMFTASELRGMYPEAIKALTEAFTEINTQQPDADLGND